MDLNINKLSVTYRDGSHAIQALEEVSLSLGPARCAALVGESGSGKTTLGKACLGLLPSNAFTEGEIVLDGLKIHQLNQEALNEIRWKKIAMVFQNGTNNLNPVHRIIDQVAEPVLQHQGLGQGESRKRAGEALEQMGLGSLVHSRFPHQLSGGQAQRVLLAMALILDPEIVILDEPTASLDALTKAFVAGLIHELKSKGKGILLITHDLELAGNLADNVAVLYLGQVMETLPAQDLFMRQFHPYTLALRRSYPTMTTGRELGGIRGDAFYRMVHQHGRKDLDPYSHTHIQVPDSIHKNGHGPQTGCVFRNRCTQAIQRCASDTVGLEALNGHEVRCLRHGIAEMLSLRGTGKTYGEVKALHPTDLTVKCGEVLCIVGETGSGKTTLGMLAAGILRPACGERIFEGQDMDQWMRRDYPGLSRRIGVVYQDPAESVSHRLSVFEAVAEPLRIHGAARGGEIRDMVEKALKDVHLSTDPAFLGRYPHELNMGAIQRVSVARALVLGPSLLIADEPTSSLDPSVQAKVLKLLLELQTERGLSMLFITHNISLARKIGDRIGVLLSGRMVEIGPAQNILTAPRHPYTRILIQSASGLISIPVKPLSDLVSSGGCDFAPRCPRVQDVCNHEIPKIREVDHREVACHFPLAEVDPEP